VPWVHNVRNTDAVAAVDDEDCMRLLRLFNEPEGRKHLAGLGVDQATIDQLSLLGISSICNLLAAIKAAKAWELDGNDAIATIFTDSAEMYGSRLEELAAERGAFDAVDAARTFTGSLERQATDHFKELTYSDRKAIHNLKYYTWVEQQGKSYEEICAQWDPEYWRELFEEEIVNFEKLIADFNREVGA
jgi:cysteine synthase